MASKTQLRLGQITGSFDNVEGGIVDNRAAQAGAANINALTLSSGSLVGVFSELASAVKRVHGGDTFAGALAGEFLQGITVADAGGLTIGAGGNEFSITESSDDVTLKTLISDKDMIFNVNDDGTDTEVFRLDGDVSALKMASGKQIQFGDAGENISGDGTDLAVNSSNNIDIVAANLLTIDAQGTDSGDGVKITLGSDTADTVFKVVNNSDSDAFTINGAKNATVGGNLTVTGDLTVNGTTTTINTDSLVVEDAVIALASGSAATADVNSALVFQRATADLGGNTDMQNGALMFLQGTGFKLGYTNDNAETAQGSLAIANDDLASVWVDRLNIAGDTNYFNVAGSTLSAIANSEFEVQSGGDIVLDADSAKVILKDAGTEIGRLTHDSGNATFILSSSGTDSISLESRSGEVFFNDQDLTVTAGLNVQTANQIKFGHVSGGSHTVGFLNLKDNAVSILSASSGLQIDAGADAANLQLKSDNANTFAFKAPGALGGSYTVQMPGNGNIAIGKVLKVNNNIGGGEWGLDWASETAASYEKAAKIITGGTVNAGTGVDMSSVNHGTAPASLQVAYANADVFVNGQLLLSGTEANRSGGNVDYTVSGGQELTFAFNLEDDDIISVFVRG